MSTPNHSQARLRSALSDAALAARERVVWRGGDLLRRVFEVLRWPVERAVWAIERGVVWPLGERAAGVPIRKAALGCVGVLLAAALALGAIRASDGDEAAPVALAPPDAQVKTAMPEPTPEPADPVLQGAVPDFTPGASDSAAKVADADAVISSDPDTTTSPDATSSTSAADASPAEDPGPAAIDVARRFSGAFVLYETGSTDAKVREALVATATPQLTRALLRRPPRLPANAEVPKAKVLNVVPGPRRGDTFTLSASLLRVGVTSELRIDVQREKGSGEWRVTDVLG